LILSAHQHYILYLPAKKIQMTPNKLKKDFIFVYVAIFWLHQMFFVGFLFTN